MPRVYTVSRLHSADKSTASPLAIRYMLDKTTMLTTYYQSIAVFPGDFTPLRDLCQIILGEF